MNRNFDQSLRAVLEHEGGFVNHPSDPGGATNKGITIATFRRHIKRKGTVDDLKALTVEQAGIVYRKQYWDRVKGDELPGGIDYATFDFAVNSGPARAAKYLQAVLGVPKDGKIGPVTVAAAMSSDATHVVQRLCDDRMAFLKRLRHWDTFKRGWTRRVDGVLALATQMASQRRTEPPRVPGTPAPQNWVSALLGTILAVVRAIFSKPKD